MLVPLAVIALMLGMISLPTGLQAAGPFLSAGVIIILLPLLIVVGWLVWAPFTLLGAWIAGGAD
jgi:hypothetical protein